MENTISKETAIELLMEFVRFNDLREGTVNALHLRADDSPAEFAPFSKVLFGIHRMDIEDADTEEIYFKAWQDVAMDKTLPYEEKAHRIYNNLINFKQQ